MKLNCTQCHRPVPDQEVNLMESAVHCPFCDAYFKVADWQDLDEELEIGQVSKYANIKVESNADHYLVVIPSKRWGGMSKKFLLFALAWNGVIGYALVVSFS